MDLRQHESRVKNDTIEPIKSAPSSPSPTRTPATCSFQGCGEAFINDDLLARHKIIRHSEDRISKERLDLPADVDYSELWATNDWKFDEDYHDSLFEDEDRAEPLDFHSIYLDYHGIDATASIYGTSMPAHSFLGSMSDHGNARSPLTSIKTGPLGLASPRSF